ncbi:hypothetical protein GOA53_01260 [Sinorhizobium meliloti]|nr:hypothetical protein [Sinorhizobium meliloti]MQV82609.1 hypothetical protein [Sinorhizobium meliloti]
MHYRFVEVEGGEDELERVANEWRAKGYETREYDIARFEEIRDAYLKALDRRDQARSAPRPQFLILRGISSPGTGLMSGASSGPTFGSGSSIGGSGRSGGTSGGMSGGNSGSLGFGIGVVGIQTSSLMAQPMLGCVCSTSREVWRDRLVL